MFPRNPEIYFILPSFHLKIMIQRIRGTRDFGPEEMWKRNWLALQLRDLARAYGYREVLTPVMESAELFVAKSGPGVLNEMYSFRDKGNREIALRPELTAPIIRFFVNDLQDSPLPLKFFSISNCFRYEEPQQGRYREFFHFDVEIIGSSEPAADAELLLLSNEVCSRLGLKNYSYRIGHVGIVRGLLDAAGLDKARQPEFLHLIDKGKRDEAEALLLSSDVGRGDVQQIMHVCNVKGDLSVLYGMDFEGVDYLRSVLEIAQSGGLHNYRVDLGVVRGLDYYTGLVFEVDFPELGAEKQICGGGAYRLSHLFGGPDVPATGFAFGFDRLLIACERSRALPEEPPLDAFVITLPGVSYTEGLEIAGMLRKSGLSVETDLMNRNLSKALKYASQRRARFALIIGEKEKDEGVVLLRNMMSGEEARLPAAELYARIKV
jgi:histidyl-tRNA synthetase